MAASPPDTASTTLRAARLNPFAFPSDTDFRFILLIVSVLGSTLLVYAAIFEALPPTREYKSTQYEQCAREHNPTDFSGTYPERVERVLAFGVCTAPADRLEAAWMLGGVAAVIIVAGGIYWTFPSRRIRQNRLVRVDDATDAAQCVGELSREADLPANPGLVWNPLNANRSGVAFGRLGRYYVAISGGLVAQLYSDRSGFRAIVLHELAHLRNADVDRTYFTMAVWQAFVAAALVPFAVSQLVSGRGVLEMLNLSWRIVPLAAMVFLTRNAVLRSREVYADVRASTWDGPAGALRRTVESLPRPPRGWWRHLWQVHPDPSERRRALDDTRPLFRVRLWDALGTGLAAGIALPNVVVLLGLLVPMPVAIVRPLGAALVCAPLAVGVVGLGVWRTAFGALAEGRRPAGVGRAGLAVGLGLVLGQELSLAAVEFGRDQGPVADLPVVVLDVVWGGLLLLVLFSFFRWVAAGASAWLGVTVDDPSPGPAYRVGLAIGGLLLAAWLGVLYFVYLAARTGGNAVTWSDVQSHVLPDAQPVASDLVGSDPLAQTAALILTAFDVLTLVSLGVWCAYPLAAWLWRHRYVSPTVAGWAFLDAPGPAVPMPAQPPLRPDRAVAVGVVGGVVYCTLAFAVYSVLFMLRANTQNWRDAVSVWTQFGTLGLATLVQVVVAVVVAVWERRLAALHGLCAALVAGCITAGGTIGVLSVFGVRWDGWQLTLFLSSAFIIAGACVSGPLALCAASIAERMR